MMLYFQFKEFKDVWKKAASDNESELIFSQIYSPVIRADCVTDRKSLFW